MNERFIASVLIVLVAIQISLAQCTANAGKDTTLCVGLYGLDSTIKLGGEPLVAMGTPPYSYKWSCMYQLTDKIQLPASTFLDDTTSGYPAIIASAANRRWISFFLEIRDKNNFICRDTVRIRFSSFGYLASNFNFSINRGDSINFLGTPFIGGGISPLMYTWLPDQGLADPHRLDTKASPRSTTSYKLSAIDSVGCTSDTFIYYQVFVDTVTAIIPDIQEVKGEVSPNPINNYSKIRWPGSIIKPDKITVYQQDGRTVFTDTLHGEYYAIGKKMTLSKPGAYIAILYRQRKMIARARLLKE